MVQILNYTIPSDNRELQPVGVQGSIPCYYTIPSDNRELQQTSWWYYRERIIPYQVITGNYNQGHHAPAG